ncbi:hypothetical protein EON65_03370 [archaeon]|nr:MAG: hypothetical protein EON65_03370 [archaeon]
MSDTGVCYLQLQGVNTTQMSLNIPIASDTAWAVGGRFKNDYGGPNVTHYCVFLTGGKCIDQSTTNFTGCATRCFGYGFTEPAIKRIAPSRSVVDVYSGMGRWEDDGQVDLWAYPRNCSELSAYQNVNCTFSGPYNKAPSFNPQGFAFTIAGSGQKGFQDGSPETAQFNFPQDLAVDELGNMYVADTKNHAIRLVMVNGTVLTIAGQGPDKVGFKDGPCQQATFSNPKGVDVRHEWINNTYTTVILVADTGNHRIRRIDYNRTTGDCVVRCLTGLCGNNSLSASDFKFQATPLTGYADGLGLEARFSAPESVAFLNGNYFVVADTGNFLVRLVVASNGTTYTLAGNVIPGQRDNDSNPLPGCVPPCMQGQQGYRDGNLTYSQFYNPLDVTRGPNNTVWVVDEQRIRIIELPNVLTNIYTIQSTGRVSTIAGTSLQGFEDGIAHKSNFFYSSGVFVNDKGVAYVADQVSCRIRRITPYPLVSQMLTCSSTLPSIIRPSGCVSYDMPLDSVGRKISRVEGNVQYNYDWPNTKNYNRGMYIKNCVGVPPVDIFDKRFLNQTGDNLVVDDLRTALNEFSEEGMAVLVQCPSSCSSGVVEGSNWYSERSSICSSAVHDGKITAAKGGIILVIIERLEYLFDSYPTAVNGTLSNGIQSIDIPRATRRVFRIESYNMSNNMVHSIGGQPSAPLQSVCGFKDAQPATLAMFDNPTGIAARYGTEISDVEYLYIADKNNHRIRALSAVCTFICENGGRCVGDDKCSCPSGWSGIDCTVAVCSSSGGLNEVCVAPDILACKPGFSGPNCDIPQCQQTCHNGGTCSAPDTCKCPYGWFDANCTTPVCSQTCGNGGNCTAPDTCACPSEWTGIDCRIPVCNQICLHNGYCVAPNTCACPPQWANYDCSAPICHQGYFEAFPGTASKEFFSVHIAAQPTYKNCDIQSWCNATNEFECDQLEMSYGIIRLPSGPEYRAITGRKVPPNQCMNIELPITFKVPYQLVFADKRTTGDLRYSPKVPYESNDTNPWKGYLSPTEDHTGPWTYTADRQIANVNWLNQSQGRYVCANKGVCVAPEVCACAPGWAGFDCRTPVCDLGYYKPDLLRYTSGEETDNELDIFLKYMGPNSYRLRWPYSNPNFTVEFEYYNGSSEVIRVVVPFEGVTYLLGANYSSDGLLETGKQGGYKCSIRGFTEWENEDYVFDHPNYYSQYMDKKVQYDNVTYTFWENMLWPPTHQKSRIIDQYFLNFSFAFTNEGYRRKGIWNWTGEVWRSGICIVEFDRNCSTKSKEYDLYSNLVDVFVQDTDLAYRPRITYNDLRVVSQGRWKEEGGQCVDEVIRGCYNNGTCVAPNTCKCATGWKEHNCSVPICAQPCLHNGNCTFPDTCTCEKGWAGRDCSIPLCAQECQNGGKCVAPDTCQCVQFDTSFYDNRIAGGRPLFQDENGDPLQTGWTGYDCATPICVQAEKFLLNVISTESPGYVSMGGHGADTLMTCTDPATSENLPRCPQFDEYLTGNDGKSFQSGCGWDPFDTGCCLEGENNDITCYKCDAGIQTYDNNTFYCAGEFTAETKKITEKDSLTQFLDPNRNFRICGKYHQPRDYNPDSNPKDYGVAKYYVDVLDPQKSSFNYKSNWTSDRFMCHIRMWVQGDYIDDAGLGSITGVGSIYGLTKGRHTRINTPNIIIGGSSSQNFTRGANVTGEGVYQCYNKGTCIGPDTCTCTDGYDGYDCRTPLCRHLQPSGAVSSCQNGGICISKDKCECVQTPSVLYKVHENTLKGKTGWTGSDCSMPICVHGYYDPFCTDLPQAPGGEGCYRCANGGNCTAPDVCTCAPGWTGYDCRTPVCEVVADPLTRTQIGTIHEEKIVSFESDPCGLTAIYGRRGWKGRKYARGNCTQPNQCTCLCKIPYDRRACRNSGKLCNGPWQDPLVKVRNLLMNRGPEFTYGTTDCQFGFEGNVDELDRFTTCHQTIYYPSSLDRDSLPVMIGFSIFAFFAIIFYRFASVRLRRKFLLAKIERRRTKRSSEESLLSKGSGNFGSGG